MSETRDKYMAFQSELWDAINAYAIACGANPARYVGDPARMNAVASVNSIIDRAAARGVVPRR